ncbi:hypothetical protein Tco_0268695 [Tanacetum coccineum]
MNQNFNSFGFDHIQPPQQFNNHQPQEIPEVTPFVESKEWIETNNELYTIMEDFMKRMNQQREQEALLVAQREQELREQEQAAQEKEELSPNFIFRQLIEEMCGTRARAEQKAKYWRSMLDLLEIFVEDLIPIPRESEDTSGSDSKSVLPSSNDFSPIFEEKSVTFSNPLFDSNDFTSSDNELLSDEDVLEDVKIYSNSLFEFDDEYISSDVNPLFDEVLEDIECRDSYDSNLDESTFLVTPISDANEAECFDRKGN